MTRTTTLRNFSLVKNIGFFVALGAAVATAGIARAADDTWNHPLVSPSLPTVEGLVAQDVQALSVFENGVPVWTDDFRPPPKDFHTPSHDL